MISTAGIDNIGHEFFTKSSSNLLASSDVISGTQSFPFSIDIPETWDSEALHGHQKKTGLMSKLKNVVGHHDTESSHTDELEREESNRLPPSALRHEDITMGDTGDIEAVYSVKVSVKMHSVMEPDVQ